MALLSGSRARVLAPFTAAQRAKLRNATYRLPNVHYLAARARGLPSVTRSDLVERKTSDTLFILGSGASILSLNCTQWEQISLGDSIGLNQWAVHNFVPTFYAFEVPRCPGQRDIMLHNLAARRASYSGSLVMVKAGVRLAAILPIVKVLGVKVVQVSPIAAVSYEHLEHQLSRRSYRSPALRPLPQITASVDFATLFGIKAGYSRLVYVGVDLTTKYFYESPDFTPSDRLIRVPVSGQMGEVHRTIDPGRSAWGLTATGALEAVARQGWCPQLVNWSAPSALDDLPGMAKWGTDQR